MNFFQYKGYPLVRKNNELYYGNMYDDYVVWMQILGTEKKYNLEVANKIKIYLMSTDEKLNPMEAISKTSERDSLYEALDVANAWLERAKRETA